MPRSKSAVSLTEGERNDLRGLLKNGVLPVRTVIRALVLLRLDEGVSTPQAGAMFELSDEGVRKIALRYREGGLEAAVYEGARPGKQPALDKTQEQKVVALACGAAPARTSALDSARTGGRSQEAQDRDRHWPGSHPNRTATPRPQTVAGKKCGAWPK